MEALGGKGKNLVFLEQNGVQVPPFEVIQTSVFLEALQKALNGGDLTTLASLDQISLSKIRATILSQSVPTSCQDSIEKMISSHPRSTFAVRSSCVAEDSRTKAFAGQFETILNVNASRKDLEEAIKKCWACVFEPESWKLLQDNHAKIEMAVVLMVQIDSQKSGVSFSQHPIKPDQVILVEASFGQGKAVVDGLVIPDRWEVSFSSLTILAAHLGHKTFQLRLGRDGGLVENAVKASELCLTHDEVHQIANVTKSISQKRGYPTDIEWCIDGDGRLWILQARDITKVAALASKPWNAPGPGPWFYDSCHYPKPQTKMFEYACSNFTRGFRRSSDITGSLIEQVNCTMINGVVFLQVQPRSADKVEAAFGQNAEFFNKKLWQRDWKTWIEKIVPERQAAHLQLKMIDPTCLSDSDLLSHWKVVASHYSESFFWHHIYDFSLFTVHGWFLHRGSILSGAAPESLLLLLQGASPTSRGVWYPEVAKMLRDGFAGDTQAKDFLQNAKGALGLEQLSKLPGDAGRCVRDWLLRFDHYVLAEQDASGYTYRELPDLVLENFRAVVFSGSDDPVKDSSSSKVTMQLQALKDAIKDEDKRNEFQDILEEALMVGEWRDQRAIYNEVQSSGLVRFCLMEIGKRIMSRNVSPPIEHWDWLLDCSPQETAQLFLGEKGPSKAEILERRTLRLSLPISEIPPFIPEPQPNPPDPSGLPPGVREAEISRGTYLQRIFTPPPPVQQDDKAEFISGQPAHPGVAEGFACVITGPGSLANVRQGDIAVVENTNASFSAMMAKVSAIVSDFGGTLCHAAISAREFGIPCIVATFNGTKKIHTGDRIRVDGTSGTVKILSSNKASL